MHFSMTISHVFVEQVVCQLGLSCVSCTLCRRRFQHSAKALAGGQHFGKPLSSDGVIDGRSVLGFQHLPRSKQNAAAQEIGSTRTVVLNTLTQLVSVNTFF